MKMKTNKLMKILLLCFSTWLVIGFGSTAVAQNPDFEVNGNGVLVAYHGAGGDVVIPGDLGITEIGQGVFAKDSTILSVSIPNSVVSIGDPGFFDCKQLSAITVETGNPNYSSLNGVLYDKAQTILYCYPGGKTDTAFSVPNSVVSIESYAFFRCRLTSVTIPSSTTFIGEYAFSESRLSEINVAADNPNYSSVDGVFYDKTQTTLYNYPAGRNTAAFSIPNSVVSIAEDAFGGCFNLTSVIIPNSVTSIGSAAFWQCVSLATITVSWLDPKVVTVTNYAFYMIDSTCVLFVPAGTIAAYLADPVWGQFKTIKELVFVSGVTLDKTSAFMAVNSTMQLTATIEPGNAMNKNVSWSSSDKLVATVDSTGLVTAKAEGKATITVASVENPAIKDSCIVTVSSTDFVVINGVLIAYLGAGGDVVIPGDLGITEIGENVFASNTTITSVSIPEGVTKIGNYVFFGCTNLTSIKLPDTIERIGERAFSQCGLTSVILPGSVTSIDTYAFYYGELTSVTIPKSVVSIGDFAFGACRKLPAIDVDSANMYYSSKDGVLYNKAQTILCGYPAGKSATVFSIPNYVTAISKGAFSYCGNLTSVIFPNTIKIIGGRAFQQCGGLTSVTIPGSVTTIDSLAFAGCRSLTDVTVEWATPLSVSSDVFYSVNTQAATLHVPLGAKALYQNDPVWKTFGTIDDGTPATIAVTDVSLDLTDVYLYIDDTEQLTAMVLPSNATNKNVTWISSNEMVATVSASGLITATGEGTAIITVTTEDGGFKATCNVEVSGKGIEVEEETPVGEDGTGKMALSLTIPSDVLFSGSFRLTLPKGVQLDPTATKLADELISLLSLIFTQDTDGSWIFTITPLVLRSTSDMVYTRIVEIGYTVDETVAEGKHEATISQLSFKFDNGTTIVEEELPVTITVNAPTGIPELLAETFAYISNGRLYVTGPVAETIHIYSANGVLLYNFQKQAGIADYPIDKVSGSVLIVKGSSGWVKKVMKK